MKVETHKIEVKKTARIFQIGHAGQQIKSIWYVLHGYGQLAEYFIRHFAGIANETTLVVAPEGLSRFYLDGNWGRVGASWMTKIDRLDDIQDQFGYLDQVHADLLRQMPGQELKVTVLGFSQGCATAWRWLKHGMHADNFVVWAGSLPQEFNSEWLLRLQKMNLVCVLGDEDQFIRQDVAEEHFAKLRKLQPGLKVFSFSGDHRMDKMALAKVVQHLEEP